MPRGTSVFPALGTLVDSWSDKTSSPSASTPRGLAPAPSSLGSPRSRLAAGVIHPDDTFRSVWDLSLTILVLYNAFSVPVTLAFAADDLAPVEVAIDLLFLTDLWLNFRTAYRDDNLDLVRSLPRIRSHYLRGWFVFDALASFPVQLVLLAASSNSNTALKTLGLLKCLRLLRLSRLWKFLQRFRYTQLLKLARLLIIFLLAAHWVACVWVALREPHEADRDAALYVVALYWAVMTLTTVGFGDVTPQSVDEMTFAVVVMLVGAAMYASVFGLVTTTISELNKTESHFLEKMQAINEFMREQRLPEDLKDKVRGYYDFMWMRYNSFTTTDSILADLPQSLRTRVYDHTHRSMLLQSPVFRRCQPEFLEVIAQHLQPRIYLPDECIFRDGDFGVDLFLVAHGEVVLRLPDGSRLSARGPGGYFGDMAVLPEAMAQSQHGNHAAISEASLRGLDDDQGKDSGLDDDEFSDDSSSDSDDELGAYIDDFGHRAVRHAVSAFTVTYCDIYSVPARPLHRLLDVFANHSLFLHVIAAKRRGKAVVKQRYDDHALLLEAALLLPHMGIELESSTGVPRIYDEAAAAAAGGGSGAGGSGTGADSSRSRSARPLETPSPKSGGGASGGSATPAATAAGSGGRSRSGSLQLALHLSGAASPRQSPANGVGLSVSGTGEAPETPDPVSMRLRRLERAHTEMRGTLERQRDSINGLVSTLEVVLSNVSELKRTHSNAASSRATPAAGRSRSHSRASRVGVSTGRQNSIGRQSSLSHGRSSD